MNDQRTTPHQPGRQGNPQDQKSSQDDKEKTKTRTQHEGSRDDKHHQGQSGQDVDEKERDGQARPNRTGQERK